MRTVLKFGGTSVGSARAIEQVAEIVRSVKGERIVVVSATSGTTDALVRAARAAQAGDAGGAQREIGILADRHQDLALELLGSATDVRGVSGAGAPVRERAHPLHDELSDLAERVSALLRSVAILHECTPRTLDAILSYGEHASAPIVAAVLEARGVGRSTDVSAEGVIVTDDAFGRARPLMDETRRAASDALAPLLADGVIPVVTGFVGATIAGVTTTLGRGASDFSAGILAAVLNADVCLIYTDVSGVMSADPRIVPDAKPLPALSYAEVAELSYFGAQVLHPRAVLPAVEKGIPVRILNTFAAGDQGTTITAKAAQDGSVVKATTSLGDLGLITVQGAGMSGVPGFAARVFDTAAEEQVSILMISQSSSENTICLVVPHDAAQKLRKALEKRLRTELQRHDVEHVTVEAPVAIVAAVGEGMRGTPGVAGRIFGALGRAKVNVIAIAQGSSELNISLVVAERERDAAVRAIHEEFHKEAKG